MQAEMLFQKSKKFSFSIILVAVIFFITGCKNSINILGSWENEARILTFYENSSFQIEYKNTESVKGFNGTFVHKKNLVVLSFEEYETADGLWFSVQETQLRNHKEILEVSMVGENLLTKVKLSEKEFLYTRVE